MKFSVYDNGPILKASQYTNQLGLQIIFEEVILMSSSLGSFSLSDFVVKLKFYFFFSIFIVQSRKSNGPRMN